MRVFLSAMISFLATGAVAAEPLWLVMDEARPMTLEAQVNEIVIGNPLIADVTVTDQNRILFFGKSPGRTNILMFNDEGVQIEAFDVSVRTRSDAVFVQKGAQRFTYNCTTICEQTATIGDAPEFFGLATSQAVQKTGTTQAASNDQGQ